MHTYIALLRGINVGGHKKIKMADLKALLENNGLSSIITYIQSGNIVFQSSSKSKFKLVKLLEKVIESSYGFQVPVLILTPEDLTQTLELNPFLKERDKEEQSTYFTFLYSVPQEDNIAKLRSYSFPNEEIIITNTVVYMYSTVGVRNAKFTHNFMENKLKVVASSRNYNTVTKLIELSKR